MTLLTFLAHSFSNVPGFALHRAGIADNVSKLRAKVEKGIEHTTKIKRIFIDTSLQERSGVVQQLSCDLFHSNDHHHECSLKPENNRFFRLR